MYHILPVEKNIKNNTYKSAGSTLPADPIAYLPTYIKVQIIHQAVAKTKTVLSAKATLMNTRPTRHTFIL